MLDTQESQLQRCWEVFQDSDKVSQGQVLHVKGRLKASVGFWVEVLQTSSPVVDWIQEGYKLPLIREPIPFIQANHKSALDHSEFNTEAVKDLLKYQCVIEVARQPHICSPLSVAQNEKGK